MSLKLFLQDRFLEETNYMYIYTLLIGSQVEHPYVDIGKITFENKLRCPLYKELSQCKNNIKYVIALEHENLATA